MASRLTGLVNLFAKLFLLMSFDVNMMYIFLQCAKLLNDTSVLSFYPSKFVLVSDLLDTFGTYLVTTD